MGKFDFRQIMMIILLSYGLLFAFSAIGILKFIADMIPITGSITISGYTYPPLPSIIAILLLAVAATFMSVGITEGMDNKRFWTVFLVLAVVSASLWIFLPQFLPKELQFLAGSAQSLFTGSFPTQALMAP